MKIMYYTTIDNGDGSSSTRFFESQECIDYLEDVNPEAFGAGEGGSWFEYEGTISIIPELFKEVWKNILGTRKKIRKMTKMIRIKYLILINVLSNEYKS